MIFYNIISIVNSAVCIYNMKHKPMRKIILQQNKRYFIRDQKIARYFMQYGECPPVNPPCPSMQLKQLNHFLNSRILAIHERGQRFQPIVKFRYPLIFPQCRISVNQTQTLSLSLHTLSLYLHTLSLYLHTLPLSLHT